MRKLKLQIQVSVDGFIAGPNGEMDWMVWDWDEKLNNYVEELTETIDTIILGRKLAQGFIPHWESTLNNPETEEDVVSAKKMVETQKFVFTKTLEASEWNNTELLKGDLVSEITNLKKQDGKDIIVYGGGTFVSSLITESLIDEYYLFINPAILGNGMTIFKAVNCKRDLRLVESNSFACGIAVLNYEPK